MIEINKNNSLKILHNIYYNYESYIDKENINLKQDVKNQLNFSFEKNNLKLIGDIPYFTLYNIQQTRVKILDVDEDGLIGIIGESGIGKSNLSFICSYFLDSDFSNLRIIFNFEELLYFLKVCAEEIQKEENDLNYKSYLRGVVVVLDEGVFMLFSADVNTKQGKLATKLFTVIRFLNIVMFINITNFEKLNKTIRESRLYSTIKITKKGVIEYRSKKKTRNLEIDGNNSVVWNEPNFIEKVGFISKDCDFWNKYNFRKGKFVKDAINEIIGEFENVNKKN